MNISTDCDWSIHLEEIRFTFEDLCSRIYYPESLFFGQSAFSAEMLLQKLQIRLRTVMRRKELIVSRRIERRSLNL